MTSKVIFRILLIAFCVLADSCQIRRNHEASNVKSNGQLTSDYLFVRRIERPVDGKVKVATGVLLSTGFMLVPAHFLDRTKPDCGVIVDGMRPSICRIHPRYNPKDLSEEGAAFDFGFLYFSSQYSTRLQGKPNTVRLGAFNIGQTKMDVTLYGFGSPWVDRAGGTGETRRETGGDMTGIGGDMTGIGGDMTGIDSTSQATDGKKRKCLIRMERALLPEEIGRTDTSNKVGFATIAVDFPINSSDECVPAPGDSGGPIFNDQNFLIGIASRVAYSGPKLSKATFVSITNQSLLEFMKTCNLEYMSLIQSRRL
jgi:hypothetical protein